MSHHEADAITETNDFVFFWKGWPSQWFPSSFSLDGVGYNCCEQFMMAEKARVFGDQATLAKILATDSPAEQKSLGRKIRNFDGAVWKGVCRGVVYAANLAKFSQNPVLRERLLATGRKVLVEASPLDTIWGIGLSANNPRAVDPAKWRGVNWLGVALMQVRDALSARAASQAPPLDAELQRQLERRAAIAAGGAA